MDVPTIDVHDTTLSRFLTDMESGKLQVPRFQRGFVWPLINGILGSDLYFWHPQGERFGAGDETRDLTTFAGRDYSTIDLTAKRVVNRLNSKSEGLPPYATGVPDWFTEELKRQAVAKETQWRSPLARLEAKELLVVYWLS